jgi:hypothetical protein
VTAFGWRDGCEPTISKPTSFIRRALPCHASTEADLSHDRFWGANPSCHSPSSMTKDDAPQQSFLASHRCVRRSSVTTSPAALQREIGALTGPVPRDTQTALLSTQSPYQSDELEAEQSCRAIATRPVRKSGL